MKLLSVAIPCYNSAAYMRNCIESLLPGGDEVEILIVDDGSTKDNTAEIADEYEGNYPGICRAIHQENGGHGEAVNAGLRNATGVYYKVVDSDDWVNEEAYMEVLDTLRKFVHDNVTLDMLITNFVYEKQGAKHRNNQQNTVDSASSENENFREFTDAIFRDNVSGDILSLHTILQYPENYGITNYEKTLGRYNLDNPTDSSDISDCLTQLNSFDKNSLSKDQQITYELLKKYLQTKLEYCDLFLLDTDLSTTIGIQVQLPIIFAEYTFNESKRY